MPALPLDPKHGIRRPNAVIEYTITSRSWRTS
jgi:hypothetical protein